MLRSIRPALLGLLGLLSCAGPLDRPGPMSMSLRLANLQWSDIDGPLHLRIFDRGDLHCASDRGVVLGADGNPSPLMNVGGRLVLPHDRCEGTAWDMRLRDQNGGEAHPTDVCFMPNSARAVDVPPGNYIVLVEGPGTGMDPSSGAMVRYRRASGCREIQPMPNQNLDVPITLVEQPLNGNVGTCGDGMRGPNEQCDDGMNNHAGANCNEVCRFPERVANGATAMGRRQNPAVAWAPSQPMLIGFNDSSDVFVHAFDANGRVGAVTTDVQIDPMGRREQQGIALAAGSAGYAAAWTTFERSDQADIEGSVLMGFDPPMPAPMDAFVNATTNGTTGMRDGAGVAVNSGRAAFVFLDNAPGNVRIATSTASSPLMAPASDAAVTGATNASSVRIVAAAAGFVVVWASTDTDVHAVRTDAMGVPMGAPIVANMGTPGTQSEPAVAANGDTVAIAWRDTTNDANDNDGNTVRFRVFSSMLAPMSGDVTCPTTVAGDQTAPAVAVSNSGRVLVSWRHSDGHIRGRFFNASGAPVINGFNLMTNDFQISAGNDEMDRGPGPRFTPAAAFGGNNLFVVVWEDRPSDLMSEIRMRVLLAPQ